MSRFRRSLAVLSLGCSLASASTSSVTHREGPAQVSLPTGTRFSEPIIATAPTTKSEDSALTRALNTYSKRTSPEDLSALESYVQQHPGSGWDIALETNLGLLDYHFGYLTLAIGEWDAAWSQGKDLKGPRAKALVDRAFGELLVLNLRTGHFERVEALLKEVDSRPVSGSAIESVDQATAALLMLRNHPEESSQLCGPEALRSLLASVGATPQQLAVLNGYQSPSNGESLSQLAQLANQAALDYGLVFRQSGQPVPVPSIVHWKFGHYAAIVGEANGKFHIQDPAFGRDLWVTRGAIDAEASGYFLAAKQVAAAQWRPVGTEEADQVRGMYRIKVNSPPIANGHDFSNGTTCNTTGCVTYDIHEESVSLLLQATPVGYAPPIGPPVRVTLSYNQREVYQPANFTFFNVSPNWTLNWLTYIQDDPTTPGASVTSYVSGGGGEPYAGFNSTTGAFTAQPSTGGVLVMVSASPVVYQLRYPNGSMDVYAQSDGSTAYPRNVFLTQRIDPAGNAVTLNYDSQMRLISLHDATGRLTTFVYQLSAYPLLVTEVTDPFGRSAKLSYTSDGHLSSITDVSGLTSSYTYDSSFLVNSLTTPYGTTTFTYGSNRVGGYPGLYLYVKDPLGFTEAEQFAQSAPGIPQSDPTADLPQGNIIINDRLLMDSDSFHWDKHAYAVAFGNYTMARMKTFDHLANVADTAAPVVEALKQPLEMRVWYNYPGQSTTTEYRSAQTGTFDFVSRVGRVLDDGSTQLSQADYNSVGNVDHTVDPVGRETYYDYAPNGIDVVDIRQRTSSTAFTVIATYTYNNQHLPLTYKDAAGKTTTYVYNPAGQLLQVIDALGNVTQYQYDPLGYLTRIVNPYGTTATSYTYDAYGRIAVQASNSIVLSFAYDELDRLIQRTYSDGTSDRYTYKNLDLVAFTDRLGNASSYAYDADRNLVSTTDALGNKTTRTYYEDGALKTLTDANGNTTSWNIDVEGRVTGKTYPDGTQLATNYEANTSRVESTVDALGQTKQFTYALDDRVAGLSYLNAVNPTPSVAFSYDPYFNRVVTMIDGTGTTSYEYHSIGVSGALKLAKETGPLPADSLAYSYDALGRLTLRTFSGRGETFAYDKLGRLITHTNPLGTFNRSYLDYTDQLLSSLLSGSTIGTTYHYLSDASDRRLVAIDNNSLGTRSYYLDTNAENQFTQIDEKTQESSGSITTSTWNYTYDNTYRLLTAKGSDAGTYQYTYDPVANITAFDLPANDSTATYNENNQLFNLITGGKSTPLSYDSNGNLLSDGNYTYTWDAENRLLSATSIANPSISTTFRYDGLGRRVAIVVWNGGGTTETDYAWCDKTLCGSSTTAGVVMSRYYPEGEYVAPTATSLYYAQDQLGSVRDAVAVQNGKVVGTSLYDYDPYGNLIKTAGAFTADFGYAGMLYEPNSGLDLTLRRAYSPRMMRWLSRDPAGEFSGSNLYQYSNGNPVSLRGTD